MTVYIYSLVERIKKPWCLRAKEGAKAHGWDTEIINGNYNCSKVTEKDILIIWNRHIDQDALALQFENKGAKVFVLENPYLSTKDEESWVSVGLGYHNNLKYAPKLLDSGERFKSFGLDIKPWRKDGKHILYTTQAKMYNQKGLGWKDYATPAGSDEDIIQKIRKLTERKIVFRLHPKSKDYTPLRRSIGRTVSVSNAEAIGRCSIQSDLKNAWATVVWTSNSATDSLLAGIPVFIIGPGVYMKSVCHMGLNFIENPKLPDGRLDLFNRMAWAQYSVNEVRSGFMFDCLLS